VNESSDVTASARYPGQNLRRAEPRQRTSHAVAGEAGKQASQSQAGHKCGPNGAGGVNGYSEDEPEQREPEELIDERAGARQEEEDGEQCEHCRILVRDQD
jgi:hypothetical protein